MSEVEARVKYYENLINLGSRRVYNPVYSQEESKAIRAKQRLSDSAHLSAVASMFGEVFAVLAGVMAPVAFFADGGGTGVGLLMVSIFMLGLVLMAPYRLKYSPGVVERMLFPNEPLHLYMDARLATAWTDWQEALEECKRLDPQGEAYEMLMQQDLVLRPAFKSYLAEDHLNYEQRRGFENWFLKTCAEAYLLTEAEQARSRAADLPAVKEPRPVVYSPAIALALSSPAPLEQARLQSDILTTNVREVLNDRNFHE